MRKPFCAAEITAIDHDWTEDLDDDRETLRMIHTVLASVEADRPSAPDIETCLNPSLRSPL